MFLPAPAGRTGWAVRTGIVRGGVRGAGLAPHRVSAGHAMPCAAGPLPPPRRPTRRHLGHSANSEPALRTAGPLASGNSAVQPTWRRRIQTTAPSARAADVARSPHSDSVGMATGAAATGPMFNVNASAVGPVPHVHRYVPGVSPRLANVAPVQVDEELSAPPEMCMGGTNSRPEASSLTMSPDATSAAVRATDVPMVDGPVNPSYASTRFAVKGAPPMEKIAPKPAPRTADCVPSDVGPATGGWTMVPLPVATTLPPTSRNSTVYAAWAWPTASSARAPAVVRETRPSRMDSLIPMWRNDTAHGNCVVHPGTQADRPGLQVAAQPRDAARMCSIGNVFSGPENDKYRTCQIS